MTRITGNIGGGIQIFADPNTIYRGNGYQVDWANVPDSYKQGTFPVQTNGAVTGGKNEVISVAIALATGGTFTGTFATVPTAAITYSGTLATLVANVQSAFDTAFGAGNFRITGVTGTTFLVEATGIYALTNIGAITWDAASLTSGSTATITPTILQQGAASPTSITVDALTAAVPEGKTLTFTNGQTAFVTAAAAVGATTISVSGIGSNIPDNAVAYVYGDGPKVLYAGLAMGRAGSAGARKIFPRVVTTNPAIGILIEDVIEGNRASSLSGVALAEGGFVYENRLPDAVANGGTLPSAIKTELGSRFVYKTAENSAPAL
jgi:hypothetical protein